MIIGVSGPIGAGKTKFCEILKEMGFSYISLSDVLREECSRRGLGVDRETLRKVGDELRRKYGKEALAVMVWKRIDRSRDWVVDAIRVPEEANYLREKGAVIVGIYAPQKLRFKRIMERQRDKYRNFEEFVKADNHDRALGIDDVLREADFIIVNDGTEEELRENAKKLLEIISSPSQSS